MYINGRFHFAENMIDLNSLMFPLTSYQLGKCIGSGVSASVYLAKNKITNEVVALKIFKTNFEDEISKRQFEREVKMMANFYHPCILGLRGFSIPEPDSNETATIATELMPNRSLLEVLQDERKQIKIPGWNNTKKMIVLYGVAAGMMHIHNCNGIHRDLKPANVLLDQNYEPRIADFGLSKMSNSSLMSMIGGTPLWMAPELFQQEQYTNKVDVYAFGVILYQCVTGLLPFGGKIAPFQIGMKISNGERPEIPLSVPYFYAKLISDCWAQEPEARPSFEEIVERLATTDIYLIGTVPQEFKAYQERIASNSIPQTPMPENLIGYVEDGESQHSPNQKVSLKTKAKNGDPEAMLKYGLHCLKKGKKDIALQYIGNAANLDNIEAQYQVAKIFEEGGIIEQNLVQAAVFYKKAADSGHVEAQYKCGKILEEGEIVTKNMKKAIDYYRLSADQGNMDAIIKLSILLQQTDPQEAMSYLKLAAKKGNIEAMMQVAPLYEETSPEDAYKYYQIAAKAGIVEAIFNCGRMIENGIGRHQNIEKALKLYQAAADQGSQQAVERIRALKRGQHQSNNPFNEVYQNQFPSADPFESQPKIPMSSDPLTAKANSGDLDAQYQVGMKFMQNKDFTNAAIYLKNPALNGNADAQYRVGVLLEKGLGVQCNVEKSIYFYKLATEAGHPEAMYHFGNILAQGRGVPCDQKNANDYFKAAADKGLVQAQMMYAYNLDQGIGTVPRPDLAYTYYQKAAAKGNSSAYCSIGMMAQNGRGILQNFAYAAECYRNAASLNDPIGHYNLAYMYQNGMGIPQNNIEASRLYKMSADLGYVNAMCNYAIMISGGAKGIPKDNIEAKRYAKMAADQNSPTGQCLYAQLLMIVDKNREEAIKYYRLAASAGNHRAKTKLAEMGL